MTHARFDDVVIEGSNESCRVFLAVCDESSGVLQVNSETVGVCRLGQPPVVVSSIDTD
jgi:hypothetical protein